MFSEWVVEVLKRLAPRFQPARARFAYPARFFADVLFAIFVFFFLNRRPVSSYRSAFWAQFLYIVQLFKVVYTLRFLLVELVFRELRTFFCFIHPVLSKLTITKQWQKADPCVLKVINLAFFLVFIGLNVLIAYIIERIGCGLWRFIRYSKRGKRLIFYLPRPLVMGNGGRKRRRKRRSWRYRIRGRSRCTSERRPILAFWPLRGRSSARKSGDSVTRADSEESMASSQSSDTENTSNTVVPSTSGEEGDYIVRKTRSGRFY